MSKPPIPTNPDPHAFGAAMRALKLEPAGTARTYMVTPGDLPPGVKWLPLGTYPGPSKDKAR